MPGASGRERHDCPQILRAMRGPDRVSQTIFPQAGESLHRAGSPSQPRKHTVRWTACPARTLSAICPCTVVNSRTLMDAAGLHAAVNNTPDVREQAAYGLFP